MTVMELVKSYLSTKTGVKNTTKIGYNTIVNILEKEEFSQLRISDIKMLDAKRFLIKLQQEDGKGYSTIHSIRGVLRPAFRMAYDDDLIQRNPFDFQLSSVVVDDSVRREALSRKQERNFLAFVQGDKHFSRYYEGIYILFKTGLRIGEFCGLTISDIDFKNDIIHVNHQLQRNSAGCYIEDSAKTEACMRDIPMKEDVKECFHSIIENRNNPEKEPEIDNYSGFLYLDKDGKPMVALHWEKYFQHICEKYNKIYKEEMPKVTPHVCRHTYCSNMAKSGMNPKMLQYLMGHADIGVTLDTYTHVGLEDVKEEMERVCAGLNDLD